MTDNNGNGGDEELFGKVSQTSAEEIFSHLFERGGYNKGDLERKDKEDDYNLRKTWKEIKAKFLCFGAICFGIIVALILITVAIILWRYLFLIFSNQEQLAVVLSGICSYLFGVASTLCVEFMLSKRSGEKS